MQKTSTRRAFSWSREGRGFAVGLLCGAFLAAAGTALAQDDERAGGLMQTVMYVLAELAVDTEANAAKIVTLAERLDDLEDQVAEIADEAH